VRNSRIFLGRFRVSWCGLFLRTFVRPFLFLYWLCLYVFVQLCVYARSLKQLPRRDLARGPCRVFLFLVSSDGEIALGRSRPPPPLLKGFFKAELTGPAPLSSSFGRPHPRRSRASFLPRDVPGQSVILLLVGPSLRVREPLLRSVWAEFFSLFVSWRTSPMFSFQPFLSPVVTGSKVLSSLFRRSGSSLHRLPVPALLADDPLFLLESGSA